MPMWTTRTASLRSSTPPVSVKKSKVDEKIEKFSVMRSLLAVERADVCVIMIDATEGVTEQDTKKSRRGAQRR